MELKYCDRCGAIESRDDGEEFKPGAPFLCSMCDGTEEGSEAASDSGRDVASTESSSPDETETRDFSLESSLDLYSEQSIAVKKRDMSRARPAVEPEPPPAKDQDDFSLPPEETLNLFSDQTVAIRKRELFGKTSGDRTGGTDSAERSCETAAAKTGKSLEFRCVECDSRLQIKAINKLSKMACPRCAVRMFVEPDGTVRRRPPSTEPDSVQIRKDSPPTEDLASNAVPGSAATEEDAADFFETLSQEPADSGTPTTTASSEPAPAGSSSDRLLTEDELMSGLMGDLQSPPTALIEDLPRIDGVSPIARPEFAAHANADAEDFALDAEETPQPRSFLQAFTFGLVICSPILLATFFVQARQRPEEATTKVDHAVMICLDSLGNAVRRAHAKLYGAGDD